ncbi:MAG: hypothetical protein H0T62_13865 [Parachlamydiaceae bacterium]|nr:hypothetical protein [Parachlamydiaceae bacterium]
MRILSFICFLFLCGCAAPRVELAPVAVKVVDSEEMTWIVEKITARWKHREHQRLKLEHSQLHYNLTGITRLNLEFSSQEILEMCPARDLLVDLVEEFLFEINTNPIISGELASVPFTPDLLDIKINFESFYGYYVDPFYIGCICLSDGIARFSAFDMKDPEWHSWHSKVEPYTKSREVSMLRRAAEKNYEEERKRACGPTYLNEMLIMDPCKNPHHM